MKTALYTCALILLTIGSSIADDRQAESANAETIAALESDDSSVRAATERQRRDLNKKLMAAAQTGAIDEIDRLVGIGAEIDFADDRGTTAVHAAASRGLSDVVDALLAHGATVDTIAVDGSTPLMIAAYFGHAGIVETLASAGAKIDAQSNDGRTALSVGAAEGHDDVVVLLLDRGANLALPDAYGDTPLMMAKTGKAAAALIGHGARIDQKDNAGESALLSASKRRNADTVRVLLENGADVDLANNDGRTALVLAAARGHDDIVDTLLAAGAAVVARDTEGADALHHAKTAEVGRILLNGGADVNATDARGYTALSYAASRGAADLASMLLANGAGVDTQADDGRTALMVAADRDHADVFKVLLQNGADASLADAKGRTVLQYARSDRIRDMGSGRVPPWSYGDGEDALRKADFDRTVAIFEMLAAAGDDRAAEAAQTVGALTEDEKTEWIITQGAEAVRAGDLDEGERLFSLALARGYALAPELLAVVQDAKAKAGPIDQEIARLQAQAGFQCSTSLMLERGVAVPFGGCPDGVSDDLRDKHDRRVQAAIQYVQTHGFSESASTIVTDAESSASIVWGRQAAEPR